jgi:hypothetical protein
MRRGAAYSIAIGLLAWLLLFVGCGDGGNDGATDGSGDGAGNAGGTVRLDAGDTGGSKSGDGGVDTATLPNLDGGSASDVSVSQDLSWLVDTGRSTIDSGSNGVDGVAVTLQEWTGWLIDADCVGSNPHTHTQNCNLMPTCIASGEGLYVYAPGKAFDTYAEVDWLPFDLSSQAIAKQINLVLSRPEDPELFLTKYSNYIPTIKVTGSLVTSDFPGLVEYGDWTQAVHIHSIAFYYIDGVSRYQVTSPENVALTQD